MIKVSVIVPVRNNRAGLANLLEAVLAQSYPAGRFEVLVVDNGSSDGTRQAAAGYQARHPEQVRVLTEDALQSSYAARNTGISAARGEILALVDSDCIPTPRWLESGVAALEAGGAAIVAGRVTFTFAGRPGAAELYDSMISMQMQHSIERLAGSATANLFVRRAVFDAIGLFPAVRSGGDMIWTHRAAAVGFELTYADQAEVRHAARGLRELLKKQFRIGRGMPGIWRARGRGAASVPAEIVRHFFPRRFRHVQALIDERGTLDASRRLWSIWFVAWLCRIVKITGAIHSLIRRET